MADQSSLINQPTKIQVYDFSWTRKPTRIRRNSLLEVLSGFNECGITYHDTLLDEVHQFLSLKQPRIGSVVGKMGLIAHIEPKA